MFPVMYSTYIRPSISIMAVPSLNQICREEFKSLLLLYNKTPYVLISFHIILAVFMDKVHLGNKTYSSMFEVWL